MTPADIVSDTCFLLNVMATRREVEILAAMNVSLIMTEYTQAEVKYLDEAPDAAGARARTAVDTLELEGLGKLRIEPLAPDWLDAFVECAAFLPDPDASCVALAGVRALPLITDDPKERRVAKSKFAGIRLISTLEFIREGLERMRLDEAQLLKVAWDLRTRGRFLPPRSDSNRDWFLDLLRRA